jgi:hypothetical protein
MVTARYCYARVPRHCQPCSSYCYSLVAVRCSLFAVRCSLFAVRYSLFAVRYSLFAIRYSLFAIRYSLFAIRYSLFAIRYSLFAIRYSLGGSRSRTCLVIVHRSTVPRNLLRSTSSHYCTHYKCLEVTSRQVAIALLLLRRPRHFLLFTVF